MGLQNSSWCTIWTEHWVCFSKSFCRNCFLFMTKEVLWRGIERRVSQGKGQDNKSSKKKVAYIHNPILPSSSLEYLSNYNRSPKWKDTEETRYTILSQRNKGGKNSLWSLRRKFYMVGEESSITQLIRRTSLLHAFFFQNSTNFISLYFFRVKPVCLQSDSELRTCQTGSKLTLSCLPIFPFNVLQN